eukprot:scaffold124841_cov53-Cyclotella_meneghiniana.AAC.1
MAALHFQEQCPLWSQTRADSARLQPFCGQIEDGKRIFFELASYSTAVISCRMSVDDSDSARGNKRVSQE